MKATPSQGLFFPSKTDICLKAYAKADLPSAKDVQFKVFSYANWASCSDIKRSILGFCDFLGDSLIYWKLRNKVQCHGLLQKQSIGLWPMLVAN